MCHAIWPPERLMHDEATLYSNGIVCSMRQGDSPANALLVHGERITAVGDRDDLLALAPGATRVDLDGCTVIPGFNDCHAHLLSFGLTLDQLDVSADSVHSILDIVAAVGRRVHESESGDWIHGRGYNQNELIESRHISRYELDAVSGGRPVVLDHTSGHVLVCNSAALERAGISRDTRDPADGEIDHDQHGEPTGLLKEGAMELLRRVIPAPTEAAGRDAVLKAMETLSTFGITSASDAWTGHGPTIEPELAIYRAAVRSGRLTARITLMPLISYVVPSDFDIVLLPRDFDVGQDPFWLRIGATKIFSDGALSTRTAAMREPYADDPSNRGILLWERTALVASMRRAHGAGWQIATHALGDRAVEMVLDCYEEAMTARPRLGHRHRVEHCMYADETLARRIQNLGILPSLQPDIYRLGDAYVAALGIERAAESIPTGLFQQLGVVIALSSDLPVIPGRPLDVIRSAMERKTPRGLHLGPHHAVPVMDAIRAYTWGGAYATHSEGVKGTLAPGMLADFTVLSRDPARTGPDDWESIQVVQTVVGGRVMYRR
jgi:predicted amidohydrolase YtcJ